jgi:hypothetical protein
MKETLMTIRNLTLVSLVMVMGGSTGCCGTRNFLFGRGARCGLCSRAGAIGNALNPLAPGPGVAPAAPGCGLPRCGLFGRNAAPAYPAPTCVAPTYAAPMTYAPTQCYDGGCQEGYASQGCVDGGYSMGMAGDCGCGSACGGTCNDVQYGDAYDSGVMYNGGVVDPYLGGGAVINGGYPSGGMIQGDGFQPRNYQSNHSGQFDSQGDRIISVDPLPPGARVQN